MLHDPPPLPPTPTPEPATVAIEPPAEDLAEAYPEFTREFLAWAERVAGQLPVPCVVGLGWAWEPDDNQPRINCKFVKHPSVCVQFVGAVNLLISFTVIDAKCTFETQAIVRPDGCRLDLSSIWTSYHRAIDRRNIHNESL